MSKIPPIAIIACMYAIAVMFASFMIAHMWGTDAQLLFMPVAMVGGLIIGRMFW